MTRNQLGSMAAGVLGAIAIGAIAYTSLSRESARRSAGAGESLAAPSAGASTCTEEPAACACAARRVAALLAGCFPEKALDAAALAPANCAAIAAPKSEALAASAHFDESTRSANDVLKSDPKNRFARRALAIAALDRSDFATADSILTKLLVEDPSDPGSLYYSAFAAQRRDRYNEARQGYLKVLHLNKRHIDARMNLVILTAGAGASDEARHHLDELERITPMGDSRLTRAKAALHDTDANPAPVTVKVGKPSTPNDAPSSAAH